MKNSMKSLPWLALMTLALVSVPRSANTAPPPPQEERHPHIRAAERQLREAREELRTAAHDFCGRRKEALEATDRAMRQLHLALECDRR